MKIKTEIAYMEHEGGTKFYEVAQFINPANGHSIVVNRWGKMAAKRGGGEIKIEAFGNPNSAATAARKKINEKGGRGYNASTLPTPIPISTDADLFRLKLGEHYRDVDTVDAIARRLDIDGDPLPEINEPAIAVPEKAKPKAPEPERGGEWASW